jgi:antibiotic biosynthesis monooxygenase (ABM) superfamily enzyme
MALVTWLGVFPVSLLIGLTLGPQLRQLPVPLNALIVSTLMVATLTWIVMPRLTQWLKPWLNAKQQ